MTPASIARTALSQALRDETWKVFGFDGSPRVGAVWQRFRAKWRVRLEDAVMRETISLVVAAQMRRAATAAPDLADVIGVVVHGDGSDPLWRSYGFHSAADAREWFTLSCRAYIDGSTTDWCSLLVDRLGVVDIPDKNRAMRLAAGAAVIATNAEGFALARY